MKTIFVTKGLLVACLAATSVMVQAESRPLTVTVDGQEIVLPKNRTELMFLTPINQDGPKLWSVMSAKERAELWPYLSRKMQRHYWASMTDFDRVSMRKEFTSRQREMMRDRYVSPRHPPGQEPLLRGTLCQEASHRHLSPEERHMMREQIRTMSVEVYSTRAAKAPPAP